MGFLLADFLALIMGFLLADFLLNLLALSLVYGLLHRGVLGLTLPLARGGALLLGHSLALVLVDSVALVLVLELAVPPCHIVHLIMTFWNIVSVTFFLVLGGDHGLLLGLARVVHHRGALLVGVVMALLLGDLIVHSPVLSPALLAILGMTLPLVGVLHVRLLDVLTLPLVG